MSRKEDIERLIVHYDRRLQKLKEQQAARGMDTPADILIEIEDIEVKLENLRADLETLETGKVDETSDLPAAAGAMTLPDPREAFEKPRGDYISGEQINIGQIADSNTFAVGSRSQVTVTQTQGLSGQEVADLFAIVYQRIEDRPEDEDVDKEELTETVQKIAQETVKGDQANPTKVERWLRYLARMAPDIFEVTADCLTAPVAGVATVIRKVVERARAEVK